MYERDGTVWKSRLAYWLNWIKPGAFIKTEGDFLWLEAAEARGWELPFKAAWPWRLWGVRSIRAAYHGVMMGRHVRSYASVGIGMGAPAEWDLWVLYAISRGWA